MSFLNQTLSSFHNPVQHFLVKLNYWNLSKAGGDVFASSILSFLFLFAADSRALGFGIAGRSFSKNENIFIWNPDHSFGYEIMFKNLKTWLIIIIVFLPQWIFPPSFANTTCTTMVLTQMDIPRLTRAICSHDCRWTWGISRVVSDGCYLKSSLWQVLE